MSSRARNLAATGGKLRVSIELNVLMLNKMVEDRRLSECFREGGETVEIVSLRNVVKQSETAMKQAETTPPVSLGPCETPETAYL